MFLCDKMNMVLKIKIGCGNMKKSKLLLTSLMLESVLAGCNNNASNKETTAENNPVVKTTVSETKETTTQEVVKKNNSLIDKLKGFLKNSKSTEEIYVTGDVVVGESGDVKPGIYDLEITGGSGNISGKRKNATLLFINFVGSAPEANTAFASKIRLVLFDGDTLKFNNISKIKFNAVQEDVQMKNELGIGEYIVGIDIKPGTYKLSTNMNMNPQYKNLGWGISIYNDSTKKVRQQKLNPGNTDVVVKLEEGEIITTSFHNTDHSVPTDEAKLIFTNYN